MAHHKNCQMASAVLVALALLSEPAAADPALFDNIHKNDTIRMVVANGECDGKVIDRDVDQLTVSLEKTTQACGPKHALVTVSRNDVQDVVDERPSGQRSGPHITAAGFCTTIVGTAMAVTAGQLVGETKGDGAALAVTGGGIGAGAILCHLAFHRRGVRYSVFTDRVGGAQP